MEQAGQTPRKDLMESALRHYAEASLSISIWDSSIPQAIRQYYAEEALEFAEGIEKKVTTLDKIAIADAVIDWIKKHEAVAGEVIMQTDSCIIDAPVVLSNIVDDILKLG